MSHHSSRPINGLPMILFAGGAVLLLAIYCGWALVLSGRAPQAAGGGLVAGLAIAWAIWRLHRAFTRSHGEYQALHDASIRSEGHCIEVLQSIVHFVEDRDPHWKGHSCNVGRLAGLMARKLGQDQRQCELLDLAGQLHDIGMLGIPGAAHAGKFGCDQFRQMTRHSEISYEMLKPLESLQPILLGVRHHHERMNGTGYPDGLAGEENPLEARILAVADAYDAMTHDRPYRPAMTDQQAMCELKRCSPAGYDPACVDALAQMLHMDATGVTSGSGKDVGYATMAAG